MSDKFVSGSCGGEKCSMCGEPAEHKVEETIFYDDPEQMRHPYTAYLCSKHFNQLMSIRNWFGKHEH